MHNRIYKNKLQFDQHLCQHQHIVVEAADKCDISMFEIHIGDQGRYCYFEGSDKSKEIFQIWGTSVVEHEAYIHRRYQREDKQ